MVAGQSPITLVSGNIQLTVTSDLVPSTANTSYVVPSSGGAVNGQSLVTLGPHGLSSCPNIGTYAQLTVLQWSVNPYSGSRGVKSALVRFSTALQATSDVAFVSKAQVNGHASSYTYTLPGVPVYMLSIQYSVKAKFNFSAMGSYRNMGKGATNFTIPGCTQNDGVKYMHCRGCNISSYTNYNVTYSCYDLSQVCPTIVVRRQLLDGGSDSTGGMEDYWEEESEELEFSDPLGYSRSLLNTDDGGSEVSPSTYGVLLESIGAEFSEVLGSNPFALNLADSTVVLVFVGCLSGFILIALLCLLKVDANEKVHQTYVKKEADLRARRKFEDDIRRGQFGDHSMVYEKHLHKQTKETRGNVIAGIQRTVGSAVAFGTRPFQREVRVRDTNRSIVYPTSKKDSWDHDDLSCDTGTGTDTESSDEDYYVTKAAVTEFLHKLFPGKGIFTKTTSVLGIIAANHDYLRMFGGATRSRSRTIRFLMLVTLVLVSLFVDTVFFGVFFPQNLCNLNTDEVRSRNLLLPRLSTLGLVRCLHFHYLFHLRIEALLNCIPCHSTLPRRLRALKYRRRLNPEPLNASGASKTHCVPSLLRPQIQCLQ
jgi:hypothetical protein